MKIVFILCSVLFLNGCVFSKKPPARYSLKHDTAPHSAAEVPDLSKIPDAQPKHEPKSKIGNPKTYTVFKKQYKVLSTSHGFKQRGKASWYGKKFHGYHTSNGEVYDMYAMTAAHKNLPLPTYLKVTNVRNGKVVVVRVNDRGPFHGDRIIDLSYAAAAKLGLLKHGVGDVQIEAITAPIVLPKSSPSLQLQNYLQLGAFEVRANAQKLVDQLQPLVGKHKVIIRKQKLYHVQIGPIHHDTDMQALKKRLIANKFPEPILVKLKSK